MDRRNKTTNKNVTNAMRYRLWFLICSAFLIGFSLVAYNMFKMQIVNYEEYKALATDIQLRDTLISPKRGTIYDSNMKVLAQSASVWTIALSPAESEESQHEDIARLLAPVLDLTEEYILEQFKKTQSYEVVIKYKVDKPISDEVRQICEENEFVGVNLIEDYKRYYPYGDFASTILGFCGVDNQGLAGLEAYYDEELMGTTGVIISAKNGWGLDMGLGYETVTQAQDGYSLVTTIDETIQHYLEKHIELNAQKHNVQAGAVGIVMDVNTGAILALAESNNYDPNDPFTISDEETKAMVDAIVDDAQRQEALNLARNEQWRSKAVSDLYEPGSVFKVVTAAAALDSATSTLNSSYLCNGATQVGVHSIRCANSGNHLGIVQNFQTSFINSCNTAFITMGQSMGVNTFYSYFQGFGMTQRTGIDLPGEAYSIVHKEDSMDIVDLSSSSFGQTNKITPIQMITAVSTAVNGGYLVTPHLVSAYADENGNVIEDIQPDAKMQVISEETSAMVSEMLRANVDTGNGQNAKVAGYRVGGKSGTSQKLDTQEAEGEEEDYIASFVGVAPMDDPQIAILIFFDDPDSYSYYGGTLAGPVVGALMGEILPYLGIEAVYTQAELANINVAVPDVTGNDITQATASLQRAGFSVNIIGNGTTIDSQFPTAFSSVQKGSSIVLYTQASEAIMVTVPDVIGLSASKAEDLLIKAGLNVEQTGAVSQSGEGTVMAQSINALDEVPIGTTISIQVEVTDYVD